MAGSGKFLRTDYGPGAGFGSRRRPVDAATIEVGMSWGRREIEIKLRVPNAVAARALLGRAGFRLAKRRVLESNAVFDTADRRLRARGELLRLRQAGGQTILTYKGRCAPGKHKSREELETHLADAGAARSILERLGLEVSFLYQKHRTEYGRPGERGMATVDETPIGVFIELEGSPAWIDRIAAKLGFGEPAYITASYGSLYFSWCQERGIVPSHMVFPDTGSSTEV